MASKGFASMNEAALKEIASKGGKATSKSPKARRWNKETARAAALKGVEARKKNREALRNLAL